MLPIYDFHIDLRNMTFYIVLRENNNIQNCPHTVRSQPCTQERSSEIQLKGGIRLF